MVVSKTNSGVTVSYMEKRPVYTSKTKKKIRRHRNNLDFPGFDGLIKNLERFEAYRKKSNILKTELPDPASKKESKPTTPPKKQKPVKNLTEPEMEVLIKKLESEKTTLKRRVATLTEKNAALKEELKTVKKEYNDLKKIAFIPVDVGNDDPNGIDIHDLLNHYPTIKEQELLEKEKA